MRLAVSAAFHSRLMAGCAAGLVPGLADAAWRDPCVPFVSGLDGRVLVSRRSLPDRLAAGIEAPVRWIRVQRALASLGVEAVAEIGPGRALLSHARRTLPGWGRWAADGPEALADTRAAFERDLHRRRSWETPGTIAPSPS